VQENQERADRTARQKKKQGNGQVKGRAQQVLEKKASPPLGQKSEME